MFIDLKQLFDIVGERVDIDYSIDLSDYELFGAHPFVTPVYVKGKAENRAGIVTVCFDCSFTLHHTCDRCLKEFDRQYDYSFSHTLVVSTESDSDDYIAVGEETNFDLDELVITDVDLRLPTKILCKDDCKGLCSECGANLNDGDCDCKPEKGDLRLAILGTLLE